MIDVVVSDQVTHPYMTMRYLTDMCCMTVRYLTVMPYLFDRSFGAPHHG